LRARLAEGKVDASDPRQRCAAVRRARGSSTLGKFFEIGRTGVHGMLNASATNGLLKTNRSGTRFAA
jgi:hypothetical protein